MVERHGRRLLVTGAAGFIGHHVVREARLRGWSVTILDDLSTGRPERVLGDVPLLELDLRRPDLAQALAGHRFDAIIHLAAQTSVRSSMEDPATDRSVNVDGTARLLAFLRSDNPRGRFVFVSSAAVYGPQPGPLREDQPLTPVSFYGAHKAEAEELVRASGLSYAILRLANVYGPGQRADSDGGVVAIFLDAVRRGDSLRVEGTGEQRRDFIYVRDVARALVDALQWKENGTWNVSTGRETSLNAVIARIAELAGAQIRVVHASPRPGDICRSCLSNECITTEMTWRPLMSLPEGLAATFVMETKRMVRSIAVVPAYNEEPTVAAVLEQLYVVVDEVVVVDDGSTDGTRAAITAWLPGHERVRLLCLDRNQGMSAAYHLAFTDLRARMQHGELDANDLVLTVDADGQHELRVLDDLRQLAVAEQLDALLVRRDLSTYPLIKRFGNWVISAWATLWARRPLPDVESGYRIFRLGALADALRYYKGYRYSETVEVAIILCRLGYLVRNDVVVPVPVYRSRTRLLDAAIDLAMIPLAAARVTLGWPRAHPDGARRPTFAALPGTRVVVASVWLITGMKKVLATVLERLPF